jgi:hypothetical protein
MDVAAKMERMDDEKSGKMAHAPRVCAQAGMRVFI